METENARVTAEEEGLARKQLGRVLTSRCFRRSERLGRFLSYLAERSLLGDVSDVKEYTIALDVFGKDESFNPRRDPIVRVEARRLRSKLNKYYATEGADDRIVLELRLGSYVLLFRRPVLEGGGSSSHYPCVFLQPFTTLGASQLLDRVRDALMAELLDELSRAEPLRIVVPDHSCSAHANNGWDAAGEEIGAEADWIIQGALRAERAFVRVSVRLIDAHQRELRWARSWDLPPNPACTLLETFASSLAGSIRSLVSDCGASAGRSAQGCSVL